MIEFWTIVTEINNHLKKGKRKRYTICTIGQTDNVKRTLFEKCNLPLEGSWYIFRNVKDTKLARSIVEYFVRRGMKRYSNLRFKGATTVFCYARKVNKSRLS